MEEPEKKSKKKKNKKRKQADNEEQSVNEVGSEFSPKRARLNKSQPSPEKNRSTIDESVDELFSSTSVNGSQALSSLHSEMKKEKKKKKKKQKKKKDPVENDWSLMETAQLITEQLPKGATGPTLSKPFAAAERLIDWQKVAFGKFSSEDCKQRWKEVRRLLKTTPSMFDLLDEAKQLLTKPSSAIRLCKDYEKAPPSAYLLFCQEQTNAGQFASLSFGDRSRLLAKRWRALTDAERQPYERQHQERLRHYSELMASLREREDCDELRRFVRPVDRQRHLTEPKEPTSEGPVVRRKRSKPREPDWLAKVPADDRPEPLPINAFFLFLEKERAKGVKLLPAEAKEKWAAKKEKYGKKWEKAKRRYETKLEALREKYAAC